MKLSKEANYKFDEGLVVNYSWDTFGTRNIKIKYSAEVIQKELHMHKVLTSYDEDILKNKVEEYIKTLKLKYRDFNNKVKLENIQKSVEQETIDAKNELEVVENILLATIPINDAVDWDSLKNFNEFEKENPFLNLEYELKKIEKPSIPILNELPKMPLIDDFQPKFSFLDRLISSLREQKLENAKGDYNIAIAHWEHEKRKVEQINTTIIDKSNEENRYYKLKTDELKEKYRNLEREWLVDKEKYYKKREKSNLKVDEFKLLYEKGETGAVEEYCELVLNRSKYPDSFPQTFDLLYSFDNKTLVIDYELPSIDKLPSLKEVKYISKQRKEYYLSDSQLNSLFDLTILRICLRTIHEIFEADVANNIENVCFNGFVNALDKTIGHRVRSCIISLQTTKVEFVKINLADVDVKACFKALKGVGSSKLSGISAIKPIIQIDKNDKRIVEHYDVGYAINESTNLASMDWEDFEHLIREIFEKEFKSNGGEVNVTQASRDGGVDAIAWDPDPIRGGKIVIQAKRYTNVVGVSAVRDLFGTVSHEGATKGILVTTANYGPDAYEFAKGKPITLLNGSNLLHLLEKHGYKAKIDISEAKKLQNN